MTHRDAEDVIEAVGKLSTPMSFPDGQLRFLVLGCGSIGKRHIRNLLAMKAGEVFGFDIRADRRVEAISLFGITVFDDIMGAWSVRPNVAVIAVPTALHVPLAIEAAKRGCHIFIEKPVSHNLDGLEDLLAIVRRERLVTLVGCNLRFHPGLRKIKELAASGAIGRIITVRAEAGQFLPDWHPWEDYRSTYSARRDLGGGALLDFSHELDYVHWLLGDVKEVFCFADRLSGLQIETEDVVAILVRATNGALGEIHVDYIQRAYSRSCHVIGEEGTIRWDWQGGVRWFSARNGMWELFPAPEGWEPNNMYVDEMKHFVNCLHRRERALLDVEAGVQVLHIALAAQRAAAEGRVQKVPLGRCFDDVSAGPV